MQALNEQCQNLIQYMEDEKRKEKDLLSKISLIEGRVMKCRERMGTMGGIYCAMVSSESIAKQIRILENRLNKGMQKYSEAVAYNKKLKEEINNLRRERVAFDNLYRKMERDLLEKKRSMAEVIDMANAAYKVRDEAHQQVAVLKAQAGKEHKDFEKERSELSRLIEVYQKSKQIRQTKKYDQASQRRTNQSTEADSPSRLQDAWSVGGDSGSADGTAAQIETYKAAFAKIQEATGMPSIDQLLEAFVNAEEQNFSLYNYVNALSADIEAAEANIVQLQRDIDNFQSSSCVTDKRKQEVLQELEAYCTSLEKKTKMFEGKNEGISKKIGELKLGIQRIFDKLECHELYSEELWFNQGLNDSTVVPFLQAIEHRADTIIEFYLHQAEASEAADEGLVADKESVPEGIGSEVEKIEQVKADEEAQTPAPNEQTAEYTATEDGKAAASGAVATPGPEEEEAVPEGGAPEAAAPEAASAPTDKSAIATGMPDGILMKKEDLSKKMETTLKTKLRFVRRQMRTRAHPTDMLKQGSEDEEEEREADIDDAEEQYIGTPVEWPRSAGAQG
ncbi:conserved hypothetical protein [Neospora caninum Liverpool]|uniref:ODAD1 central coiled coil region domain-containing protein n=1 Tax=Neospora caninum (strain Liverpool) TaxID=572307 RepID=F0VJN0_NEOCL|nr:conserved hypothetical protein [Neospora caninum Liverpool]CBZ53941.1 conserved hypothetical protein [Neospora caninum Liverpool]|eukprot:XP_003883973.1 conserved hypothetical protein [Neospora caninum Liverpool]